MKIPRVPVIILEQEKVLRDTAMVIPEVMTEVRLNNKRVINIICRPDNPEEPSIGLLINNDVIPALDCIKAIRVHPRQHAVSIQARINEEALKDLMRYGLWEHRRPGIAGRGAGSSRIPDRKTPTGSRKGCGNFKDFSAMTDLFHDAVEVKGIFGAYCVAALANRKAGLLCQAGDVDMCVTVDRVFGKAFLAGIDFKNLTLLISGRLRADSVLKAARHGIGTVTTTSVVTRLALEAAADFGIQLLCAKERETLMVYSLEDFRKGADPEAQKTGSRGKAPEAGQGGLEGLET